ncbi:ANTAR domain-containing response regulator [Catenisphaera adipataccumulans]|jgi:AmiR/NasT family two-component response regulator|uniref:Response regulator NasT n=1 Tax=Catenisphaera adipataccumulans TaxID=700500 RepID=A0A7W8CXA6_9FIRM|nr:ANTAR domain-containing protein [Catenisphaera adipataccumulans]MBB5183312.1 response regulator NasT [Catenisphaera adipataccumulans]
MKETKKVIVVSRSNDTLKVMKEVLPAHQFQIIHSFATIADTKKALRSRHCDLLIVQAPLKDEQGVRACLQIKNALPIEILLLVKADIYDQVLYQCDDSGICVLSLPCKKSMVYQSCSLLMMLAAQKRKYEAEIARLKQKMQNEKVINRAKLVLIEDYHWTEDQAHKYIEHAAMDTSKTKFEIARDILEGVTK